MLFDSVPPEVKTISSALHCSDCAISLRHASRKAAASSPAGWMEDGLAGKRVACAHGDAWCTRDRGYRLLRGLTRGPLGRLCMAAGPFFLAELIVGRFQESAVSRIHHFPRERKTVPGA